MRRKAYKSDLTDLHWRLLEPLIPADKRCGRHRSVDMREVVNGIFYVLKTGCSGEMLPHDLPPYSTVDFYFRRWQKKGVWEQINQVLREQVRIKQGKSDQTTAAIADSQKGYTTEKRSQCVAGVPPVVATGVGSTRLRRRQISQRS